MIVGIGLDVVELARLERIIRQPHGPRFIQKVLTALESERLAGLSDRRKLEYIAGRFAAKEAVVKALGCGIGASVGFLDIEIAAGDQGKPLCRLSPASWRRLGLQNDRYIIHVAITHERNLAAANAIVEQLPEPLDQNG